ncbi:MAG: MaoC/PaaZ C-terminal domain-containing protein [Porticoccaceae bacterium]
MAINPETLLNWRFDEIPHSYTHRDVILYALGVGLGRDPLNRDELTYVYEKELVALPTFAVTLSTLGLWVKNPDTGITWTKLVHSGQNATFYKPLPPAASVVGRARISQVYDRGADKGAVIVVERSIHDASSDDCYCKLEQTLMLRADGGFGGNPPPKPAVTLPDTPSEKLFNFKTTPGQAIIYRLSGDWNPLHIDLDIAAQAGFPQPILHGYCSYGIAGWALCQATGVAVTRLHQLECQFTGPVLPGDELSFELWQQEPNTWLFRASVNDRIVLNKGMAVFTDI